MGPVGASIFLVFCLALYLIPAIFATMRSHPAAASITVLNLILGWTLLFWVISLVWALAPIDATKKYR